ncbi:carbon-nitrogen hydrolase [Dactylonectria estremocensis]|uniref:Carbon-nitrogen hydrolase n=1 Tax=Dactylonectria estremocensis TaxID=1079267 RepID=A0A9P9E9P0_9HYPO|nr:carbon-nitrogen hydrolase [Dactylonectria estremocensis]
MSTIRLGTASPGTQSTTAATIALIDSIARRAASSKIDILLLPEAFIGGYPRGSSFGCAIGGRSDEGREEFAKYFDQAIDLGDNVGPGGGGAGVKWVKRQLNDDDTVRGDGSREELERIARDTGVFIVTGCIEKTGGSLYCSVVYVCPKEGMLGKRRKVLPTGSERLVWAQGAPSTLKAVSTTIRGIRINLAAAICWENYMPLLRQTLYSQNINLYLAPTADNRDAWLGLMRTVGVEGRCFVVSSNMAVPKDPVDVSNSTRSPVRGRRNSTMTEEGFEIALPRSPQRLHRRKSVFDDDGNEIILCKETKETQTPVFTSTIPEKTEWVSRGGSSIVTPFGDVVAGPQWEDPDGLIFADVDFRNCIRGRLDLDAAGSYSRNDSFRLSVEGLDLDPLPY